LLIAARSGRLAHAQRLLADGADPNVHTAKGWTPIHSAAYNRHVAIVKLVVQHHAGLELKFRHESGMERTGTSLVQELSRSGGSVVGC
jgi:hypothetical protein